MTVTHISHRLNKELIPALDVRPSFELQTDAQLSSLKSRLVPNGEECLNLFPRVPDEVRVIGHPGSSRAKYPTGERHDGNSRAHCAEALTCETSSDPKILQKSSPVCLLNPMFLK